MELSDIRVKIDAVDEQLLDLFLQRIDLAGEILRVLIIVIPLQHQRAQLFTELYVLIGK